MRFKKGQTATEYLIILAVVIVIALIVVGVLGGIPSIGGGAKSNSANSYWRTSTPIGISSVKVVGDGTNANVTIVVRNNGANTITLNEFNITNSAGTTNTSGLTDVITAGATATVTIVNVSESSTAGSSYSYSVLVDYTDSSINAGYSFDGDGNKLEGTIAQS